MKRKRIKKKIIIIFLILVIIISLIVFSISVYNIIVWKKDSRNTNNVINITKKKVTIKEKKDTNNTEIIINDEPKYNPYWDYINMNLIDVNFNNLKSINNDVKGWIKVNGTNINYPIVKTNNNDYYLTHSFDKSYNRAGWIFMDYRNKLDGTDKNTIIYGHSRLDKTMFGSLKNILTSGWLNNHNNYIINLSTEYENTLWQVFSIYNIHNTSDYLEVDFNRNEDFENFAKLLLERSSHKFNTTVNGNDRIITLSTCYNNNDRVVLHAKLIKREIK